jgi:hypothetical protein
VKSQVHTIKCKSKRKGITTGIWPVLYSCFLITTPKIVGYVGRWGPVHKAKGEGGGVIGGGVVDIDVEIDVEHDYQTGAPEKLLARVEIVGQGSA